MFKYVCCRRLPVEGAPKYSDTMHEANGKYSDARGFQFMVDAKVKAEAAPASDD